MIYDDSADIYDLQYEAYRSDIPHYVRLADELGGPVLELGAGTGRVTEALARAGHDVVAVEVSEAMLARASKRFAGTSWESRITPVLGDMRSLDVSGTFPLIIAPFNTLMHAYTLADQDATLANVAAHLAPGGVFAFDVYRIPGSVLHTALRLEPEWHNLPGGRDVFLVQEHDAEKQILTSRYFIDQVVDGALTRRKTVLSQRYYHRFELERLLRAHGFSYQLYGSFQRDAVQAGGSYFVVLAQRSQQAR